MKNRAWRSRAGWELGGGGLPLLGLSLLPPCLCPFLCNVCPPGLSPVPGPTSTPVRHPLSLYASGGLSKEGEHAREPGLEVSCWAGARLGRLPLWLSLQPTSPCLCPFLCGGFVLGGSRVGTTSPVVKSPTSFLPLSVSPWRSRAGQETGRDDFPCG